MEVRSGRPGRGRSIANGRDLAFQHVGLAPVGLAAGRPYGAQHACGIYQELKAVASAYVLATNRQAPADVRFGLLRGRREDILRSRVRASSRFMHRSKIYFISNPSSTHLKDDHRMGRNHLNFNKAIRLRASPRSAHWRR